MLRKTAKIISFILALSLFATFAGCNPDQVKLDPKNPVTVTVWHYYNGAISNAFAELVNEFNETIGMERGIIVEASGLGSISELERAVLASANKEVGSMELPNIFASYADTAYYAETLGILANLDDYFTEKEQGEYISSYVEEGRIGLNGELRIFPVAKSTEILMVNETDWTPFAAAYNLTYDNLSTIEGIAYVSELYYSWTDAKTPEPDDGKAFFGRDSLANFVFITFKEFGTELFQVDKGIATMNFDREIIRKLWDNFYLPYISGYFYSYGRYRSDDAKVGDILAYVGSTASAAYFPAEVTTDTAVYPVTAKALPVPHFENAGRALVQQGAGMVVIKSTSEAEYASVEFLKWFTEMNNNTAFAVLSGYMPVKREAVDYNTLGGIVAQEGIQLNPIASETLRVALAEVAASEMYTSKAFGGSADARALLESAFQTKITEDRAAVVAMIESGVSHADAVAAFNTEAAFNAFCDELSAGLSAIINK